MHANAAAARQDVGHNTREVAEMLHAFIGLGNSVILTASGHRVALRSTQDMTIDPYLLVGLNTNAQWYLYEIYRAGKLMKTLNAVISASFLR